MCLGQFLPAEIGEHVVALWLGCLRCGLIPLVGEPAAFQQQRHQRVQPPTVHARCTPQIPAVEPGFDRSCEEHRRQPAHFLGRPHGPILDGRSVFVLCWRVGSPAEQARPVGAARVGRAGGLPRGMASRRADGHVPRLTADEAAAAVAAARTDRPLGHGLLLAIRARRLNGAGLRSGVAAGRPARPVLAGAWPCRSWSCGVAWHRLSSGRLRLQIQGWNPAAALPSGRAGAVAGRQVGRCGRDPGGRSVTPRWSNVRRTRLGLTP